MNALVKPPLLRSVSLEHDLATPARLAHYRPTSRSLPVARAVLSGKATMVIAAYGSGKSLAAGVGALCTMNDDRAAVEEMAERIAPIDADFAQEIAERAASGSRGRVAVLSGYVRDVAGSIAAAFGLDPSGSLRDVLKATSGMPGADRIAVVWDEFGRHLEALVAEGRSRKLHEIQQLAEWASRASGPSASLTLLLHQSFLAYAGGVNQATRNEWRKVEGRFEQVRFVEDSREMYHLVADAFSARGGKPIRKGDARRIAADLARSGWLDGIESERELARIVERAAPASAAAVHVLPRLAARVAQNERSLFAFIDEADVSGPIGMSEVYGAFSEAMRSDVGIGGIHRRWVEAEAAMSRADGPVEREALAAAFLLRIGAHGERRRLPRADLELALATKGIAPRAAADAVDGLIDRKLLIHRKLNDDVSVWHGADVDVGARLDEERKVRADGFDLMAFLAEHHPAPFLRPVRHNAERGTSRYFEGAYVTASDLSLLEEAPAPLWGRIAFVACGSGEDVAQVRRLARSAALDRTILVVPSEPLPAFDAALEIDALLALKRDEAFMSQDPLVGEEVDELLAVARRHLSVVMHRLTTDRPVDATWLHGGDRLDVGFERAAGVAASDLMDEWYPLTPRIANDQLMRGRLSRQMQTARVRVVTRVMENALEPGLGYAADDASAEASVYRTVLARTGLHLPDGERGRFALPEEIADDGLRRSWEIVRSFFTEPGRKKLTDVVGLLSSQPIGMPGGVVPLIVMAGYKAFGRAVSFRSDGAYVGDVMGFDSTRMFLEPERHQVEVHEGGQALLEYLSEVAYVFSHARPSPLDERVRFALDALASWRAGIAEGARKSRRLSDEARTLLSEVSRAEDAAELLVATLPSRLGGKGGNRAARLRRTVAALESARNAVDGLVEGYLRDAVDVVAKGLNAGPDGDDAVAAVQSWVSCLDVDALMRRADLKMTDKSILRTARETSNGRYSPESLARTVSSVLLQRGVEKWQDDTADLLRKELRECRMRIEAAALDADDLPASAAVLIRSRIAELQAKLDRIGDQGGRP